MRPYAHSARRADRGDHTAAALADSVIDVSPPRISAAHQGRFHAARASGGRHAREAPGRGAALAGRVTPLEQAIALEGAGRLGEAAACLRAAARATPGDGRTWSTLGRVLLRVGEWREAAAAYEAALRLAPADADTLANYGVALAEAGAFERAVDAYAAALAVDADHAIAHYNLGNALRELRRFDDAIASYARALRLQSDWP